jgi:hypothetical protein
MCVCVFQEPSNAFIKNTSLSISFSPLERFLLSLMCVCVCVRVCFRSFACRQASFLRYAGSFKGASKTNRKLESSIHTSALLSPLLFCCSIRQELLILSDIPKLLLLHLFPLLKGEGGSAQRLRGCFFFFFAGVVFVRLSESGRRNFSFCFFWRIAEL